MVTLQILFPAYAGVILVESKPGEGYLPLPRIRGGNLRHLSYSPGSMVTHKAFGTGKVTAIEKGVITVSFDGLEKKFQFPGAFQQGFLRETR